MKNEEMLAAGVIPVSIASRTAERSMVDRMATNGGTEMENENQYEIDEIEWELYLDKKEQALMERSDIATAPETMAMATAQAQAFCAHYHPWGMTEEDVAQFIVIAIWDAEWVLLAIPEGKARDEALKAVVSTALGLVRDESKANRSRLQPYQVTKVALAGGDVDTAYVNLGKRFAEKFATDPDEREKLEYLKDAVSLLGQPYAKYCMEYLNPWIGDGSWDKVADHHGISPSTFRHRELKEMARRGKRIWKMMWGN